MIIQNRPQRSLGHATDGPAFRTRRNTKVSNYHNAEEKHVITGCEKKTAIANGESVRNDHYGKSYDVESSISVKHKKEEK